MKSNRCAVTVGLLLAAFITGCIDPEPGDLTRRKLKEQLPRLDPRLTLQSRPADTFLTYIGGGQSILPRSRTKWERDFERRYTQAASMSLPHADTFDDYRDNNYDTFFITKAPTSSGLRAPAEFEASQAYLLAPGMSYTTAFKKLFTEIIKGAWGVVPVLLAYKHAAHRAYWETELKAAGYTAADLADTSKIIWWKHETNTIWARDYGPLSVVTSGAAPKLSFVDFRYYHTRVRDDEVPTALAKEWGINVFRPDLDLEGSNFLTTSDGLCMVTKGALNANLHMTQSGLETLFSDHLGCKKVAFLEPLAGATHIDLFAKLGSDTAILVGEYTTAQDPVNKAILDANASAIAALTTPTGKKLTVTRIPMPDNAGPGTSKTWRSYTSSTSLTDGTKKVVLVPTFSKYTSGEAAALAAYAKVFPGWTIVKIDAEVIVAGEGAIHAVTMQIPKGAQSKMEADPKDLCGATKWICNKAACGNIPVQGCCNGAVLKHCNAGKLVATDCTANPKCGWDSANTWYDCGTVGGADTSGTYSKSCNVVTDASVPDAGAADAAPAGCQGLTFEGCCDANLLYYCDKGKLEKIDCSNNAKCGWQQSGAYYNCGTVGGADPLGKFPKACSFGDAGAAADSQVTQDAGGCGSITQQGCCEGTTLKFCQNSQIKTQDCSKNPSCGWDKNGSFYNCGTSGGSDPGGTHPLKCPAGASDAGAGDASTDADQGPQADAGAALDSSLDLPLEDAGADLDASAATDGGVTVVCEEGCSCGIGARPGYGSLLVLSLMLGCVLLRRRRRPRPARRSHARRDR